MPSSLLLLADEVIQWTGHMPDTVAREVHA